jgi:hypothetical protein
LSPTFGAPARPAANALHSQVPHATIDSTAATTHPDHPDLLT